MNISATLSSHSDSLPSETNYSEPNNFINWIHSNNYDLNTKNAGLQIYYVVGGEVNIRTDQRSYTVRPNQYLLVNAGQSVRINYQKSRYLDMLLVQLDPKWLASIHRELIQSCRTKHTDSLPATVGSVEVYEHVYQAQGNLLGEFLGGVSEQYANPGRASAPNAKQVHGEIGERLVLTQCQVYKQLRRLTSAKLSTKKELYRRLCIARSYIHANLDSSLDLDTLAQVACLSKYHFIRLFKEVFGQTPRQYLIARRLERASKLLLNSNKSFHEICQEVGLKDSSSFGRLFKRSFGATPHLYRQMYAG